jgi:hypothetical protein
MTKKITSTGPAESTELHGAAPCGGAVESKNTMHLDAKLKSMWQSKTMLTTKKRSKLSSNTNVTFVNKRDIWQVPVPLTQI